MSDRLIEGLSRRGLFQIVAGIAVGAAADRAASMWFGNPVPLTEDENTAKKAVEYEQTIRKLHGKPLAEVWAHHKSLTAENMFLLHLRTVLPEATSVARVIGDFYFCKSRFKKGNEEIKQGADIYQRYTQRTMGSLLAGVPEAQSWRYWHFSPFGTLDPRENNNYGSIQLWLPSASLPDACFIFTFSHNQKVDEWIQQPIDSWKVIVQPQNFRLTTVDLESYDPAKQPPSSQSKDPTYDKLAVIVTNLQGEPIAQKVYQEHHWDGFIRDNSPFKREPRPELL